MTDILYTNNEANALTHSEMNEDWRKSSEILKAKLILDNIEDKSNLVDIGCGWGSTLLQLNGKIEKLVGKPVITSNQAQFWSCLRRAGVKDNLKGFGKLFDHQLTTS